MTDRSADPPSTATEPATATTTTTRRAPSWPTPTSVPPTVAPTLAPAPSTSPPSVPTTRLPVPPPPSTTAPIPPADDPLLRLGDDGPAVREVQVRLSGLGYWLGEANGSFDELTRQAVYAFQKIQGLTVDGVVGPEVRTALEAPQPVASWFAEPAGVEIDLTRQVVLIVRKGSPFVVLNTSTGTDERYEHPTQGTQLADTPVGRFTVSWAVDGISEGELGPLYRPKFFHPDGIAVHGYDSVPVSSSARWHACSFPADSIWVSSQRCCSAWPDPSSVESSQTRSAPATSSNSTSSAQSSPLPQPSC